MSSPTSLGKRKAREEEGQVNESQAQHGSTLFISNLPYTATSTDLQTLFSDLAPVRSAFVVTEQGSGNSKGVGYVSFGLKEDAETAFAEAGNGLDMAGRKLRIQWADQKMKNKTDNKTPSSATEEKKPKQCKKEPVVRGPQDPDAIRTIVVSGLPSGLDKNTLWKKVRKLGGAQNLEFSPDTNADIAHVVFSTPAQANEAVSKLHAHVFKGSLLSVTLKKRLDGLSAQPSSSKSPSTPKPSTQMNHNSRLIVRNIPFGMNEQDLRSVFLPYGPIHNIHIPTSSEDKKIMKGFAFVWMLSRKDAERALEKVNGTKMFAGMANSKIVDVGKKKKERREEEKERLKKEGVREERMVAVDWALSKDRWEEEKAKMEVDGEEDADEGQDSAGSDEDDDESDDELGVHASSSGSESDSDASEEDEEDEYSDAPTKPSLPAPETGNTLFVRNVPFEATEDDLRTLFKAFGSLRYARITLDPSTGRSRGTAFACFWNKEDADKVVEQSELLRAEMTVDDDKKKEKKNPFSMPSILTPDPSSMLAQSLVLHGRTLDCVRAVTRDIAGKLKEEGERKREKADKRNMYLLREGVILPSSPAAQSLPPAELEKRTNSFNARRQLLKTNPSLYISKTRLSIRQIPTFVTERMIKRLALHALKSFNAEVKEGTRSALSADELREDDDAEETNDVNKEEENTKRNKRNNGKKLLGTVKQAKIVRQHERIDSITGKARSKGYGFLELYTHADALRVLRWANNNPVLLPNSSLWKDWWKVELDSLIKAERAKGKECDEERLKRLEKELGEVKNGGAAGASGAGGAGGKTKGSLIVEFSIENVQVVQRRSGAAETQMKRRMESKEGEGEGVGERPTKRSKFDKSRDDKTKKTPTSAPVDVEPPKAGQKIGSIIGRKRKQRASKGK